jgi:hypothetical protein
MKLRLTAILLLLASGCVFEASPAVVTVRQGDHRPTKTAGVEPRLQLTTDIIERKEYLRQYVGFTLRLTFKNVGGTPIILNKDCFLLKLLVSRNPEAAAAKQYESVSTFDYMGAVHPRSEPAGVSDFVTLKPGEEYTYDTGVGSLKVHGGEGEPLKGELGRGKHYLQLGVSAWSYMADPAPFRRKWRKQGFLWYEELVSQSMPFTV